LSAGPESSKYKDKIIKTISNFPLKENGGEEIEAAQREANPDKTTAKNAKEIHGRTFKHVEKSDTDDEPVDGIMSEILMGVNDVLDRVGEAADKVWNKVDRKMTKYEKEHLFNPEDSRKNAGVKKRKPKKRQEKIKPEEEKIDENKKLTLAKLDAQAEIDYGKFVDALSLSTEQKEKLKAIVAGYKDAVESVKILDPDIIIPSKEQVIRHIIALGVEKLEKIATIMGKPELVIVPDKSAKEVRGIMRKGGHIKCFNRFIGKPSNIKPGVGVKILDMVQYPDKVPGQKPGEQTVAGQIDACEKFFRENGMHLVSELEYAAGIEKAGLIFSRALSKGEEDRRKHLPDFKPEEKRKPITVTAFDQDRSKIPGMLYGFCEETVGFGSYYCYNVSFKVYQGFGNSWEEDIWRGRGVVDVM
jgi:hypothetical protein